MADDDTKVIAKYFLYELGFPINLLIAVGVFSIGVYISRQHLAWR